MATLGEQLREARERKKLTSSQVAASTHIKPTHVDAMEHNDYSRISSPIYAKGFIKLYAELVELDPAPLIQDYLEHYAPQERPPLVADTKSARRRRPPRVPLPKPGADVDRQPLIPWDRLRPHARRAAWVAGAVALAVGAGLLLRGALRGEPSAPPPDRAATARELIDLPPLPYLEPTGAARTPPAVDRRP